MPFVPALRTWADRGDCLQCDHVDKCNRLPLSSHILLTNPSLDTCTRHLASGKEGFLSAGPTSSKRLMLQTTRHYPCHTFPRSPGPRIVGLFTTGSTMRFSTASARKFMRGRHFPTLPTRGSTDWVWLHNNSTNRRALRITPSDLSAILEVENLAERSIAYSNIAADLTGFFASTSGASREISSSKWTDAGRRIESQPSMWFPIVLAHFKKWAFEDHCLSRVWWWAVAKRIRPFSQMVKDSYVPHVITTSHCTPLWDRSWS
jgi:hypothetical protein